MTGSKTAKKPQVINQLHQQEARWFAVYTKYKCEKFVAQNLQKKGIEAYVPTIRKTKRYTRKIKHYDIPLIHCYAFVRINAAMYTRVLECEHVLHFVKMKKNLIAIPESEILLLKRIVGETQQLVVEKAPLSEGQEVEIIAGNLTGIRGTLVCKQGKHQFLVSLHSIGYQLKISIDPALLQAVGRMPCSVPA